MSTRPALLFLALTACKPATTQADFPADYANAYCRIATTCLAPDLPEDQQGCVEVMLPVVQQLAEECPSFDLPSARSCLALVNRMSCDQALLYSDPAQDPGVCDAVYSCYTL